MVKKFFDTEFSSWADKFDTDAIIPLVNKLGQFLYDPMLRNIFNQKENRVDLLELMNKQKIILINLSRGRIGEENSNFFGSVLLTKIKQAGMERAIMPESERHDCNLYLYDFQNIATQSFENILSEARKYGINLTMAHQYIGQLQPKIQQAVLGNVGSVVSFRVGGDDAVKLKSEFAPIFDVKDMINLAVGEFYIKMTIDGESYDPFSAETLQVLPPVHPSYKSKIIESSRRQFAVSKEEAKRAPEEKDKE
jgi:hypothetical protein